MRTAFLAAAIFILAGSILPGCGKSGGGQAAADADSPAARQAAAEASQVTSIPGYTPSSGNVAANPAVPGQP
jgi:hypothetical protein